MKKRFEPLADTDCEQLKQEVAELIQPLAEKHGICLEPLKVALSSGADSVAINVRFSLPKRPDSVATLKEELDFRCYAEGFGMQAEWLGKEFQRGNFTYKVAGLMVEAADKCVVLERSDGSRCQQNGKMVARYLA